MLLIQMPRGFGKSTAIVNLMARDPDSICIVTDQRMAEYMAEMLLGRMDDLGLDVSTLTMKKVAETRFFTPIGFQRSGNRRLKRRIYVDDLDMVLSQLLGGVGIAAATYSPSEDGY